jgi:hypothetical protein
MEPVRRVRRRIPQRRTPIGSHGATVGASLGLSIYYSPSPGFSQDSFLNNELPNEVIPASVLFLTRSPRSARPFLGFPKGEDIVRKLLLSVLSVAMLLGAANFGFAQSEMKPLVTASFAGYDRLKADLAVIGRMGGNPQVVDGLEFMLQMMTQGKGLAGLDTKRPWGLVATESGPAYGFIPVTNLKQLIEVAKANPRLAPMIKVDGDVYEVQPPNGAPIFIQQKGDWAIVTTPRTGLATAPADPLKLLGDMPKKYGIAVRVSIKNLPDMARQMFLMQLQRNIAKEMAQKPGEPDAEYAGRKLALEGTIQVFTTLVNDLDEVMLGWSIDGKANTTALDLEMTAKPGTGLAAKLASMKAGKSIFAGLKMPGATVTVNKHLEMSDADVVWAKDFVELMHKSAMADIGRQGLADNQAKLAKEITDDLFDVVNKTIDSKKSDAGLAVMLEPGATAAVFGGQVADGAKLETALKKLVEGDADAANAVKLNTETYEGVRFHTISVPTDPKLVPILGPKADIVIGIADDKLLVAVGRDAAKLLKKVLDDSKAGADKELPPVEIRLAVAKLTKFAGEMVKNHAPQGAQMRLAMLVSAMEKAGDKDHVTITASPIPNGVRVRVEMEEGLLKAIASVAQMAASMGMQPPPGPPGAPPPVEPPFGSPPPD